MAITNKELMAKVDKLLDETSHMRTDIAVLKNDVQNKLEGHDKRICELEVKGDKSLRNTSYLVGIFISFAMGIVNTIKTFFIDK